MIGMRRELAYVNIWTPIASMETAHIVRKRCHATKVHIPGLQNFPLRGASRIVRFPFLSLAFVDGSSTVSSTPDLYSHPRRAEISAGANSYLLSWNRGLVDAR